MDGVLDKNQKLSEGRVEAEDGKLDFEKSSDDTEVELLLPRKGANERVPPGQISEMCRKRRVLSGRTGLIWRLKWNRAGRPSGVLEEPRGLEAEASGGKAGQDVEERGAPAPPLTLHRQNMQEVEGVTPPRREVQGHGGLQAPGSRLPPRGTQVAPQIFTEPRDEMLVQIIGMCHGPLRTF